jgi:hypothetical protein
VECLDSISLLYELDVYVIRPGWENYQYELVTGRRREHIRRLKYGGVDQCTEMARRARYIRKQSLLVGSIEWQQSALFIVAFLKQRSYSFGNDEAVAA